MKNIWKWIIGIIVGLVVLGVLVGGGLMVRSNFHGYREVTRVAPGFYQRVPEMMPYGGFGHLRGPVMMGHGFLPFGGIFACLVGLGFLVLLVLGIIVLVRSLRKPMPVAGVPAATSAVVPETMPAVIENSCKKCGKPLQSEWKACPFCGKKV
jgi:hypothetical protein